LLRWKHSQKNLLLLSIISITINININIAILRVLPITAHQIYQVREMLLMEELLVVSIIRPWILPARRFRGI
jgi:hypothetical protein